MKNKKKKFISNVLKISVNTINHWINKYNNNYINMTIITHTALNDDKQNKN